MRSARSLGARVALGLVAITCAAIATPAAGETKNRVAAKPKPASPAPTRKRAAQQSKGPARVAAARSWHAATPGKSAPLCEAGRPKLVLQALNHTSRVELAAASPLGGFAAEDVDRAAHVLREPASGNEHPIDPRLLDLIYRLQVRFGAEEIRVISGYRTPRGRGTSNHGKGRAMDVVVPGASDEDVARFAREQGFTGVGVYPVSGFVHVDVRERSFFWVDRSGPGQRGRVRGILGDQARKSDLDALARGERGVLPFVVGRDVDVALAEREAAEHAAEDDEHDDDDGREAETSSES